MVEVFAIKTLDEKSYLEVREKLVLNLPESQASSIKRFKRLGDEQRSLFGELLSRYILSIKTGIKISDLMITKTEKGKPVLQNSPDVYFNISHSGKYVVAAIAPKQVGIDIEEIKEPVYRIAERYFSKTELEYLNSLAEASKKDYFFDLWTLKESYLKMLGKGLTKSLGSFTISGSNGEFKLIENNKISNEVFFRQYNVNPQYKLSVSSGDFKFTGEVQHLNIEQFLGTE